MCNPEHSKKEMFLEPKSIKIYRKKKYRLTNSTISIFSSYFWLPGTYKSLVASANNLHFSQLYSLSFITFGNFNIHNSDQSDMSPHRCLNFHLQSYQNSLPPHIDTGQSWNSSLENIKHFWHWRYFSPTFPLLYFNKPAPHAHWIFRSIDPSYLILLFLGTLGFTCLLI